MALYKSGGPEVPSSNLGAPTTEKPRSSEAFPLLSPGVAEVHTSNQEVFADGAHD
jgi:hypothetical protein